ncbi:MAG: response regulator transcription factor [Actinobacteria bacterium]|nr:MAG: response regulator transcription factor [Actinomycetota bacterium]
MRRLKVLIADDHRLMLHSIRLALQADEGIEIVAEVDSGKNVIPFIGQTGPDAGDGWVGGARANTRALSARAGRDALRR